MKLLRGFTVLDLGTFITAPYAAMLLAELGADVIKVERPEGGDPFRWFAGGLSSPHFQAHNRHKRSVALDYTTPDGLKLLHSLIEHADALVINVRPGVEQRLGIDEATLRRLNPKLVFCFITGFGADGPYANRPAYDNVGQALAGWLSRFHDTDDARVAGPAISDAATGIFACLGIVSALLERTKTGVGRKVEVSMLEATLALAVEPLAHYFVTGDEQPFYLRGAMSQAYILTCKDGKRIALQMSSPDKFWKGLAAVIVGENETTITTSKANMTSRRGPTASGAMGNHGHNAHATADMLLPVCWWQRSQRWPAWLHQLSFLPR